MLWIGLTGGMGCGKSTALKALKELNCGTESADAIVSDLYESHPVLEEISKALGITLDQDLESLKSMISKKVFQDPKNLKTLESILHPKVREKALKSKQDLESKGYAISFYEVPLLFEKNLENQFDKTVCIGAKQSVQIERIKKRNPKWSDKEIQNRLNSQMSLEEKKQRADFYIDNSGDLSDLKKSCERLLRDLTGS
jgi:dephospho-CoA kinase